MEHHCRLIKKIGFHGTQDDFVNGFVKGTGKYNSQISKSKFVNNLLFDFS